MRGTKEREGIQERIVRPWGVLGKEGIVLARKERCRRWQPLMIISLASVRATERPTVEDRVADLRGFEYPLHSPRHRMLHFLFAQLTPISSGTS
jgi:hypothetical protein